MAGDPPMTAVHPAGCWCSLCQPLRTWTPPPGPWICPRCSNVYGPQALECTRCNSLVYGTSNSILDLPIMILCPICGNKRCPKAQNAAFKCTGSNDLDQVGELEQSPPVGATASQPGDTG